MKRLNKTLVAGLMLGTSIVTAAILFEIDGASAKVFVHPVALFIVIGGSLSGAMISLPFQELVRVIKRTYYVVRYPKDDFIETLREIIQVSIGVNKDVLYLEKLNSEVKNAMFKDGLSLISLGFKADDIKRFLEIKQEQNENSLAQCSMLFFNMAKMGPAFGLLGTLVGLIILLYYHMGGGDMAKVASSMGVALTATLYGVGTANLVFQPFAEYLQYNAERGATLDAMIIEGTVQIKERRHPIYLIQALKAYMPREDYSAIEKIMRDEMTSIPKSRSGDSQKEVA